MSFSNITRSPGPTDHIRIPGDEDYEMVAPTADEPIPETGSTTGVAGLLLVFTSIGDLKDRVTRAFKSGSLEAKLVGVHDIIKAPFKLVIGVLSAISMLATAAKFLAISIGVVMSPAVLAACAVVFAIASTIYLTLELIRSITILVKSGTFMNKQQVGAVLRQINLLNPLVKHSKEEIKIVLDNNEIILKKHMGEEEYQNLFDSCAKGGEKMTRALHKARAILTYTKLNTLYQDYVVRDEARHTEYFARRIGGNAAKAFSTRVQNIKDFDLPTLGRMTNAELKTFIEQGKSLLTMVNKQTHKVLKVHMFSVFVILVAGFALVASSHIVAIPTTVTSIAITCFATGVSVARTCANDGYIDNSGNGFDLRLAIPRALAPTGNETVWSIWRVTDVENPHISRILKCLYIFGSIISVGLLPIFDGTIFKADWVRKARGLGADYDLRAEYDNMRVPLAPGRVLLSSGKSIPLSTEPVAVTPLYRNRSNASPNLFEDSEGFGTDSEAYLLDLPRRTLDNYSPKGVTELASDTSSVAAVVSKGNRLSRNWAHERTPLLQND